LRRRSKPGAFYFVVAVAWAKGVKLGIIIIIGNTLKIVGHEEILLEVQYGYCPGKD